MDTGCQVPGREGRLMAKQSFDSIDALKAFVGKPAVSGEAS